MPTRTSHNATRPRAALLLTMAACLLASSPRASADFIIVHLGEFRQTSDAAPVAESLDFLAYGNGFSSGTVTPPGGSALALDQNGWFATRTTDYAAYQLAYRAGDYTFIPAANGGSPPQRFTAPGYGVLPAVQVTNYAALAGWDGQSAFRVIWSPPALNLANVQNKAFSLSILDATGSQLFSASPALNATSYELPGGLLATGQSYELRFYALANETTFSRGYRTFREAAATLHVDFATVPEPSAYALGIGGLLLALTLPRRRNLRQPARPSRKKATPKPSTPKTSNVV